MQLSTSPIYLMIEPNKIVLESWCYIMFNYNIKKLIPSKDGRLKIRINKLSNFKVPFK